MRRAERLAALERIGAEHELVTWMPRDDHDHAAEWQRMQGKRIGIVRFPGLNDEAVAAFHAAKPEWVR